jgi:hypothetical protein
MGATYQKMARDLILKNLAEATRKEYPRCCTLVRAVPHPAAREHGSLLAITPLQGFRWARLAAATDAERPRVRNGRFIILLSYLRS